MNEDIKNLEVSIAKRQKELEDVLDQAKEIRSRMTRLKRAKKALEQDGR